MAAGNERVILFLDDVEQMTAIGADILQRRLDNVKVVAFNKPREALAWLKTAPRVDLLLSDHHMADMDGLTFLAEARTLHSQATRAIMTAYLDLPTTTAPELGARGVHALIRKPWEWNDFTRAVFELLTLSATDRAAAERLGPVAYPEGAFAELAASRAALARAPAARAAAAAATSTVTRAAPAAAPPPAPAPPAPAPLRATLEAARVACPSCAARFEVDVPPPAAVAPAVSAVPHADDDEETRRLLAYLRTRPGVAARLRWFLQEQTALAQRRAADARGR